MQVKFAYVMCSLKPLAFCTHRNFKNIQKRPINSSRGKMRGKKIIILIPKVFLRPLNSFEIIFRQETSTALQWKPLGQKFKTSACSFTFISQIFFLWSTPTRFTFSFQNHRMSRKFVVCSLEVGIEAIAIRIISFRYPCGLLV